MENKLTVAIIGCGNFARNFVDLFKAHPYVKKVYVCDLIEEKATEYSNKFDVEIIDSFEQALENKDINCIANFTQRHLHGDIVIRALKAGKHVYSAVPMAPTVEECQQIVELVKQTGLTYLMGETCYYYPCAMYCREAYKQGKFGDFTYGASQYYHHIDSISYGKRPNEGGMPPLLYPTHSTGMILSSVNSYVKKVSCFGYVDKTNDGRFEVGKNQWDNVFSNQYVMMLLENGGTARVTEARTFGWMKPSSYISALYGTNGGYEFSNAQHILVEKDWESEKEKVNLTDVSDYVNTKGMVENKDNPDFKNMVANGSWQWDDYAQVQEEEIKRLPKEYENIDNGHMATHKFLIDDFCKAAYTGKMPVLNAWTAARYTIPGLVAIESAKQGGIVLDVPDCGDAPTE
ncbi:MAG: Gfo/Idh/MocA family oxidoreductase [Ruminococcaceae bacterium]|nr:Gfo/Idh/MocA family oxidoreductase [Oscillospiraceae bacterium]